MHTQIIVARHHVIHGMMKMKISMVIVASIVMSVHKKMILILILMILININKRFDRYLFIYYLI